MTQIKVITVFLLVGVLVNEVVLARNNISLAFAIDSTGSMGDDLAQVKSGTTQILNKFLLMGEKSPIWNFILVSFNDPYVSTQIVTRDADAFKRSLSSFRLSGGGDCPEMCIGGIERTAMLAENGSTIYVFTDASAKDYAIYPRVQPLLIAKKLKVVFVLTGTCGPYSSPEYQVYHAVSNATDGQVFNVKKSNVDEYMKILLDSIGSDEIDTENETSTLTNKTFSFNIQPYTALVAIQATANDPSESINGYLFDPRGSRQTIGDGLVIHFVDQKNIFAVTKRNPIPGNWSVLITSSTGKFNLKINVVMNEMPETILVRHDPKLTTMKHAPKITTMKHAPKRTTMKHAPKTTTKKHAPKTTTMDKDALQKWLFKLGIEYDRTHSGSSRFQATHGFLVLSLIIAIVNIF